MESLPKRVPGVHLDLGRSPEAYNRDAKRLGCGQCRFADRLALRDGRECCDCPGLVRMTGEGACLNRMLRGESWQAREARRQAQGLRRRLVIGYTVRRLQSEDLMLKELATHRRNERGA